jgi:hypothetical protein
MDGEPLMDAEGIGEVRAALAAFPGLAGVAVIEPSPTLTPLSGTRQFGKPPRSSRRPTVRSRVADWHWEPVTDDLLDCLPPAALTAVRQAAEELTVRESMIFLDGREFTGEPPGLRTVQRGPLMLVYLTDVRGERVVIIQVN